MLRTCINLKERFGQRFKIGYDESYRADRGDGARAADPWLMIVPCRYGHIFPHGGNTLAASVDGYPKVAGMLRRLPCCRVHQDGDDGELTVLFEVGDFAKVAKVMRPRRRRHVSPQERDRLRGMGFIHSDIANGRHSAANTAVPAGFASKLAASRFIGSVGLNKNGAQVHVDVDHTLRPCVPLPQADLGAAGRQKDLFASLLTP